ncbi:MAG TPA: GH92 family glycosyl hydrolase [Candidatus Sulfotelmatobacter sp.]|nr:GH92 family glycosyl hydrolase [Candidatus Sulfotelmatobacter sp.]
MNDLSSRSQPILQVIAVLALCTAVTLAANAGTELPLSQYVNPLIGTDPNPLIREGYGWDTGNVFPGAVCPRGMLAWSPDTTHKNKIAGGYWYPDNVIEDFSLTHFSGRGVVCLMDVPFMPTMQMVSDSPAKNWEQFAATFSHTNESAAAGYYRVTLDNGIETELTATPRTGMAQFTFPATVAQISKPASRPNADEAGNETLLIRANGSISVHGDEVTGVYHDHIGGAKDHLFTIYFVAQFNQPFQHVQTWSGDTLSGQSDATGQNCGAVLGFNTANPVVRCRAAISYVSLDNARANLAQENPSWDFSAVRQKADAQWNTVLNRVQVEGGSDAQKQSFYTALYHCFMHPNLLDDVNGQYPDMDGKIHSVSPGHQHQYQNIPAWDQYRSLAPLIAVLAPGDAADIAQSMVNYAQQDAATRSNGGGLPRWQQVNRNSGGMVGDGDDIILADDYAFGVNQFDTSAALDAMIKGASTPGTTSDGFEVRKGLDEYIKLGYVPGAASVTLEYCNADFALSQFANALRDPPTRVLFQDRAQSWKNLFDDSTGLIRPRNADGTWADDFSPTNKKGYVEGTPAQYTWMVNFNLNGLIKKLGGDQQTLARLDHFFTNVNGGVDADTAFMGNEPCEETPWVYDFAGEPSGSQEVVRRIQNTLFTSLPSGLPGNDDAGALSSWYVFSALGIYPEIPGVAGFVTGSPLFSKAVIQPDGGAAIQIVGDEASPDNCYVGKLKINGRTWKSVWIPWSKLSHGANLDFSLTNNPTSWASNSRPPSFD